MYPPCNDFHNPCPPNLDRDIGQQMTLVTASGGANQTCRARLYYASLHIAEAWCSAPELKKGSTEMLILSLLEARPRHGYEIGKLIEARSRRPAHIRAADALPTLLRLENRGWIKGRWVEKAGERERCYYRLTAEGRHVLAEQRETWKAYVAAVNDIMGTSGA